MRTSRTVGRFSAVVVLALGGRATAQPPSFQGIGVFDWAASTRATAISANGLVVVGTGTVDGWERAFRWSITTGFHDLGLLPGGEWSVPFAVSADGAVAVGWGRTATTMRAFRWTLESGMVELGTLPGCDYSVARGVTSDGTAIVGFTLISCCHHAASWTASGIQDLNLPSPNIPCVAYAVSASGNAVAGAYTLPSGTSHGFVNQSGVMREVPLDPLALSADGSVAVGIGGPGPGSGYRWSQLGTTSLPHTARAVSADGAVVVGDNGMYWTVADGHRDIAAILQSAGVTTAAGWTNLNLTGVSADGLVVTGYGTSPTGRTEAWIARVAPPLCRADWTRDYVLSPADAAAFVTDWFASLTGGSLSGDYDHNGVVQPSDVGAFISAWFAAVGGNCPP